LPSPSYTQLPANLNAFAKKTPLISSEGIQTHDQLSLNTAVRGGMS
jgi:hypothetical protein